MELGGHVTELDISDFGLHILEDRRSEVISSALSQLIHLQYLDFTYNNFGRTPLPLGLESLKNVSYLKFKGAQFAGSIPSWIGNMSKLTSLDLSRNSLNGSIPSTLSKLHLLEYLDLSANDIVGIPGAILNLTMSLTYLDLSANKLSGRIPYIKVYKNMGRLSYLDLHQNQLEGTIPSSLGLLVNLTYVDLSSNMLSGPIPPSLGNLLSLVVLDLHDNQLEGSMPFSLGKIGTLKKLLLSDNKMSGDLPLSFAQLSSLVTLDLRNNQLNGSVPSLLTLPSSLQSFWLSNNNMTGTVSDRVLLRNSSRLEELDLSYSGLNIHIDSTPWIPPFQLRTLNLRSCKIGGPIPSWISTQCQLETLDLSDANLMEDQLPSWLWKFSSQLVSLNLSNNQLKGPLTVISIPLPLQVFDLSINELNGPLLLDARVPAQTSLEVLSLANNKIEGPVPVSLGAMTRLTVVDM